MTNTSYSAKDEERLKRHIPDEYVAAWNEKSMNELYDLLEKAYKNLKGVSTEASTKHMNDVIEWLHSYIEARAKNDGTAGELDTFV